MSNVRNKGFGRLGKHVIVGAGLAGVLGLLISVSVAQVPPATAPAGAATTTAPATTAGAPGGGRGRGARGGRGAGGGQFALPQVPIEAPKSDGVKTVIYDDPAIRVYYPRIMEIKYSPNAASNGTLLATCEEYTQAMPVHPIMKSTDKGRTWTRFGEVKDTQHGWGMKYQPMLFELPQAVGKLNKGTLLCAGNSIPTGNPDVPNLSKTSIDVYRSDDGGATWTFMSTVCQGGRAATSMSNPVWEPFLMLDKKGRLECYESDERYKPDHNQLLCHFVSEDGGYSWGPQVNDVALGDLRPGMVIISHLPNDKYIMTYELVRTPGSPVTYKLSDDGDDWGGAANPGTAIVTVDGYHPGSTPYNVWAPAGGKNGMIITSGQRAQGDQVNGDFSVNYNNTEGNWYRMRTPIRYTGQGAGYSRAMAVSANGKELYSVCNLPNGRMSRLNMTFYRMPLELAFGWSYDMTAGNSFKMLTAEAGGISQQADKEDASQKWALVDAGDGYVRLMNGGKALEVEGQSMADGAKVGLSDKAERDGQKWRVKYASEGFYTLAAKHSGKFLTVAAGSKDDGAGIVQGPNNGDAVKWRMDAVDTENAWADWKWVPGVY